MTKPDWENFAKAILSDWPTGDVDGSVLFDLSLQYGMIIEVPGGYNSDHHIDADGIGPEEGDPWYEYTFRGEAGPGLYSVSGMTKRIEELEAQNQNSDEEILHLRFLVELAVEALQAFKDFDDFPLNMKRPDVFEQKVRRKQLHTLAELKGQNDD